MVVHRAAAVRRIAIPVVTGLVLAGAATVPAVAATGFDETKLTATDGGAFDYYGYSIAAADDRVVVGAYLNSDNGTDAGAAYVYEPDGSGGWEETRLTATGVASRDTYGFSVAVAGDRVVIAAQGDDDRGVDAGAVYLYESDGSGGWVETKLTATDAAAGDGFGRSVAVAGDRVVVGARGVDDNGALSGAAYVYEPNGSGGWAETKLTATDAAAGDGFGSSVAVAGDLVVVAAVLDDDEGADAGAAYVYEPNGSGGWAETKLTATDGESEYYFGSDVAVAGDRVAVGAIGADDAGALSGAAYVYEPNGSGGWSETKLTATDAAAGDGFGSSVAVAGNRVIVSASSGDDEDADTGAAYVYEPDDSGAWVETKLTASDSEADDNYGISVAATDGRIVIGAYGVDDRGTDAGAVYVYALDSAPPVITVPAALSVQATMLAGAVVSYQASATDVVDGNLPLNCAPRSGTMFPLGTTIVTCTATDQAGNAAEETFAATVAVTGGAAGFTILINGIGSLGLGKTPTTSLGAPLKQAVKIITDGNPGNDGAACDKLASFQDHVGVRLADSTLTPANASLLSNYASALADSFGCTR